MKNKTWTYKKFAVALGGIRQAALRVGVNPSTYTRWINKESKPRGTLVRSRLAQLGIQE